MKVGILTFHWGTNYGAVLQAYALQLFLENMGHDVQIINYMPKRFEKKIIKCFIVKQPWVIKDNLTEFFKEKSLVPYRKKYLKTTDRYISLEELKMNPPDFDVYICGSDQIWNQGFTLGGEKKTTTSYYLDFGDEKVVRIAYAVSFGCLKYSDEVKRIVAPLLRKFRAISVREKSGCEIIRDMGYENVSLMPDPSLLLTAKDYDKILSEPECESEDCFFYVIHKGQKLIKRIEKYFKYSTKKRVVSTNDTRYSMISIEEWLLYIRDSRFVLTNSFHGVVYSIIYKKQFIVIPVEGGLVGMNDRIETLLEYFDLKERIIRSFEMEKIIFLLGEKIKWSGVEKKINILRGDAEVYLQNALK